MASNFNNDQVTELREAFTRFDKNGDGSISTAELGMMMNELGENPTKEELDQMIGEVDDDGSGTIEFPEFLIMFMKKIKDSDVSKEIEEAFRIFDPMGRGKVNVKEMKEAMLQYGCVLSSAEVEDLFLSADSEGKGEFSYLEFVRKMMSG